MTVSQQEQRVLFDVRRTLTEIGIPTRFTARGDALKGAVSLAGRELQSPLGGAAIDHVAFTVTGDGMLRLDEPASLEGLECPRAAKAHSLDALAGAIGTAMDERAATLRGEAVRLRSFGLEIHIDAERMTLTSSVDLEHLGTAVLESNGSKLRLTKLEPSASGDASTLSFGDREIDLAKFEDRMDLEIFLSSEAEHLAPSRAGASLVAQMPGMQDSGKIDEGGDEVGALVAGLMPPTEGEVWVMDVRIESDDGEEVRYLGVNIAGQAFGAPRVLPKVAFLASYAPATQGYRMLVRVTEVDDESVEYVRLDVERRPVGPKKRVSLVGFLANFTAEAAAY